MPLDPDAFQRGGFNGSHARQNPRQQQLFNPSVPRVPPLVSPADQHFRQAQYLEQIAASEISNVEMSPAERDEKESFRIALQQICHEVCDTDPERLRKVSLECFGSFKSGFATAGSDMDLVIVVQDDTSTSARFSLLEDDLPRVLEKRLLQLGYGARLLTRTRVPIIKVCEKPDASFLDKLREEREKWDDLPNEKKYPHLHPDEGEAEGGVVEQAGDGASTEPGSTNITTETTGPVAEGQSEEKPGNGAANTNGVPADPAVSQANGVNGVQGQAQSGEQQRQRPNSPPWTRERKAGPLDFPKTGVGIQSDINFFNPLGIHNTHLMRCYSLCDPRVRPMVLFVKAWAKRRKINSSYSGTLSSYGYVLMVLHYLVNVAQPPVLPNLQASWRPPGYERPVFSGGDIVDGWHVQFWRKEDEITTATQHGLLTANRDPLGSLLAGFFHYYSSQGGGVTFTWMQEVLSLRSIGGLLTKEEKGWVKSVTEEGEGKKIQHRYLFCIEDPFELNHNVARTVTHKGIVAIRDEFRRARRILQSVGNGLFSKDGELFAQLVEAEDFRKATEELKANGNQNGIVDNAIGNGGMRAVSTQNKGANTYQPFNDRYRQGRGPNPRADAPGRQASKGVTGPISKTTAFDVTDSEAFPTLGAAKPAKKKPGPHHNERSEEFSEISGERAKKVLEEVKRKRDDEQMVSKIRENMLLPPHS